MNATATATSGAAPTTTDVRDAPTLRIANVKKSCDIPGASSPASRNGHASQDVVRPVDERGDDGDRECDGDRRRGRERRVGLAREADAHRDGHPAEERSRT